VLRDDERFSAHKRPFPGLEDSAAMRGLLSSLLAIDPPDHTRLRTLVTKAFTPRMVEALRPRIQAIVDERLDAAQAAGRLELIGDLACPLPVTVIAELLGVPPADRERFKRWSDDLATMADATLALAGLEPAERAVAELEGYLREVFAERRSRPRENLITALVHAQAEGQVLTDEELLTTCILLLVAGNETTTNLIGNGVLALLEHPRELARLSEDPSLIRAAVEEMLRCDSPVQLTSRLAIEDVRIGGKDIRAGTEVDLLLGAANRDPGHFPDPDRFDVGRPENRPVAFGYGIHFCLGAALARVEAQVAVGALVQRFPRLRLDGAPERRPGVVLRGLGSLPLAF